MGSSNKHSCLFVEVMFVAFAAAVAAVGLAFAVVVIAAVVVDDYEH